MTWQPLLFPFAWVLNGLLVALFIGVAHWQTLFLAPALGWLYIRGPVEHRRWAVGISILAMLTSFFAPQPAPILILVMAAAGCVAVQLEKFNPANLHWRIISGIALYSLIGIGISAFQTYMNDLAVSNPMIAQGQTYIGVMAGVSLYGVPLGYLALLAQGLLIHPPLPGSGQPETIINTLRARRQD